MPSDLSLLDSRFSAAVKAGLFPELTTVKSVLSLEQVDTRDRAVAALLDLAPSVVETGVAVIGWAGLPVGVQSTVKNDRRCELSVITDLSSPLPIPPDDMSRVNAACKAIPFDAFVYYDEKEIGTSRANMPNFVPFASPAAPPASQTYGKSFVDSMLYSLLDPAIIGVVITDKKTRSGWWVLLSMWPH